jgi:hypothetical protein
MTLKIIKGTFLSKLFTDFSLVKDWVVDVSSLKCKVHETAHSLYTFTRVS